MAEDSPAEPPDETAVVEAAAEAAEGLVFSRLSRSEVRDLDVTVSFEDWRLDVEVYVHAPDADADTEQVAEDAVLAARSAVDDVLGDQP